MLPSTLVAAYNSKAPFDGNAAAQGGLLGLLPALGNDLHRSMNVVKMSYSFAVQGGALANIVCPDDQGNPIQFQAGMIVKRTYMFVVAAVTSGGAATVGASTGQAANDAVAQTAKASLTLNALIEGVATGTMSTAIYITAACKPYVLPAVAVLTAGALDVFYEYVIS